MRQLVAILSNHDHWRHFPLVGRHGDGTTYLFLDHRTPLAERVAAIRGVAIADDVDEIVRVVLEPAAFVDCPAGVHDWRAVENGRVAAAARCLACGEIDLLEEPLSDRQPFGERIERGPLQGDADMLVALRRDHLGMTEDLHDDLRVDLEIEH